VWDREPGWRFWGKDKYFYPNEVRTQDLTSRDQVTILTEIPGIQN